MKPEDSPANRSKISAETRIDHANPDPGATLVTSHAPGISPIDGKITNEPTSIGPYKLVRRLGEGGMGSVWLAEQTAPVKREVAIKLIKSGRFSEDVLRRFDLERQSLAIMNHPAIARVFDAGSTGEGQPYFVMEYVSGLPITKFCKKHGLSIRERIELVITICEGVQHAHQKAVIHRDLKPSNILVAEIDGKPVPRIIDFGIAKAAQAVTAENSDETINVLTQVGGTVDLRRDRRSIRRRAYRDLALLSTCGPSCGS